MKRLHLWSSLLGLVFAGAAFAETKKFQITIAAGEHDRVNVPVCVPLRVATEPKFTSVVLQDADGKKIPAQLTSPSLLAHAQSDKTAVELHFILPSLKANASVTLQAALGTEPPPEREGFTWKDTPGDFMELRFGARPVLRYMYKALDESSKEKREETNKVYHHLFDPAGERLVTKGQGGLYPHHRGLFFGFRKVTYGDGLEADVWHCPGGACQSHEKLLVSEAGPVLGRQRVELAWHGKNKEVFAREERELTVYNVPGGQLVEFASRVRSTGGKVRLDGDPQHAGFHFRADQEVAAKTSKQTYFLRPDGPGKPGETRNWEAKKPQKQTINVPWNAMCFVLGEQRYTAGYLDRPDNPKEARYSERDYGRFGSYFEYELTKDKPLEIDYRIWLQKGEMTAAEMAAHGANFVKPVTVKVKE